MKEKSTDKKTIKNGRIKYSPTAFQRVFANSDKIVRSSWPDKIPELIHISYSIVENGYEATRIDYNRIIEHVTQKYEPGFNFILSEALGLLRIDFSFLEFINQTCFKNAFNNILACYNPILRFDWKGEEDINAMALADSFGNLLDGRSRVAVLSKFLLLSNQKITDPTGFHNLTDENAILNNTGRVMASFSAMGSFIEFDSEISFIIWYYNITRLPIATIPDTVEKAIEQIGNSQINDFKNELDSIFTQFKKINIHAYQPSIIAEVNMGFAARICNLTFDVVDLTNEHRGEIVELVNRSIIESFILGSWMIKKRDADDYVRYREFSVGRERYLLEKILDFKKGDAVVEAAVKKAVDHTLKAAGAMEIDVAAERGEAFNITLEKMGSDTWGEENPYYHPYRILSSITHSHWKALSKYHLAKSLNPMHNGAKGYNDIKNRYCGVNPSFACLVMAAEFLLTLLASISDTDNKELADHLNDFKKRLLAQTMAYNQSLVS